MGPQPAGGGCPVCHTGGGVLCHTCTLGLLRARMAVDTARDLAAGSVARVTADDDGSVCFFAWRAWMVMRMHDCGSDWQRLCVVEVREVLAIACAAQWQLLDVPTSRFVRQARVAPSVAARREGPRAACVHVVSHRWRLDVALRAGLSAAGGKGRACAHGRVAEYVCVCCGLCATLRTAGDCV